MPSASGYLRSTDSRPMLSSARQDHVDSTRSHPQYYPQDSSYQSPRLQSQTGGARDFTSATQPQSGYQSPRLQLPTGGTRDWTPANQSPLARRSDEFSSPNYSSTLRSSLEQKSPANIQRQVSDRNRPLPGDEQYPNGRLSTSSNYKKSYPDGEANVGTNVGTSGDSRSPVSRGFTTGDHSTYRKSLLAEYRNSAANESTTGASRLLQEPNNRVGQTGSARHSHHQTPQATETSNFTGTSDGVRDQRLGSKNAREDSALRASQSDLVQPSPRSQQFSVFNYEGGDRSGSRNHLHMMMNHNLMNAHQQQREESIKKKTGNLKKSRRKITVNLQGTRYEIVREVVEKLGYTVTKDDDSMAYLLWNDTYVATDRISEMKSFQRINHFPGMGEICRKDCLARNMAKMVKSHPDEYNFIPKSWILPQEYNVLQNYAKDLKKKKKMKIFIAKPANGAMGNGIALYHNAEKIPGTEHFVIQEYIERPFLIDDFKCDLRIYVLVSSCDPLKVFLFNDGLVRMGTEKYRDPSPQNLDVLFMHLTNYSINKHSDAYEKGDSTDSGSKRSLKFLNDYLRRHDVDVSHLWVNITDIIIKTLICALPHVHHAYKMCRPGQAPNSDSVCFEILGFDIMLDRKLKPWLIEVNRSPSFGTNEQIDYDIKSSLLTDSLKIVNIRASDKKKNLAAQKAAAQRRLLQPRAGLNDADERKKSLQDKRKEGLKELLVKIRKDNARTEYEDRNCGRFRRVFPPQDRYQQEKYAKLLLSAFNNLVSSIGGKTNGLMTREIERQYMKKYREDEVLDMLAEYETEETGSEGRFRRTRGSAPLTGMPCSSATEPANNDSEASDSDYDDDIDTNQVRPQRPTRASSGRPASSKVSMPAHRVRSAARSQTRYTPTMNQREGSIRQTLAEDTDAVNRAIKEKEDQLTAIVLSSLQEMRIKFPGKTDAEAEQILDRLMDNWKYHKPRVASYWMVKLDSIKRRKVIDIVKSNVKAKVQHIYQTHEVESLRIFRIFNRVFNRQLWSHGQGLWACFSGNAWETIFSKSTDVISENEMECCRRITELCKDCLLIVYQFASDAKTKTQPDDDTSRPEFNNPVTQSSQSLANGQVSVVNKRYGKSFTTAPAYRMST